MRNIEQEINDFVSHIITPNFLELVEKWSRYSGESFSIGDADVHIENIGRFKRESTRPKLIFEKDNFHVSKTEMETDVTYFDVTKISDAATCADNDVLLLISEQPSEGLGDNWEKRHPRKLYIYSIDERSESPDNTQYTDFPNFKRFKEDFEIAKFQHCRSLLSEFCGVYSLSRYNSKSDRLSDFNLIRMNLDFLELSIKEGDVEKDIVSSISNIRVTKRSENKHEI